MMSVEELMSSTEAKPDNQMMSVDELMSKTEPYVVKQGDNLSKIAQRMGTSVENLTGYRSGNPNLIYPGEQITTLDAVPPQLAGADTGGVGNILPVPTRVTQRAGTRNPVEVFSGGVARDTNFSASPGTPALLPPGQWRIEEAFKGAGPGHPGDGTNQGYGNKVTATNLMTGEKLVYEHLDKVNVKVGDVIMGGQVGTTGSSGNTTGPNLGVEFIDNKGHLGDILNSRYADDIPLEGQ